MKSLLLLLFIPFSSKPIPWRVLSVSDFKARPYTNDAALTESGINIETTERDGQFYYSVESYFVPDGSFIRVKTDYILAHEQLHFDITELYARRIRALAFSYSGCNVARDREFQNRCDLLLDEMRAAQIQYDKETNNSRDKNAQAEWECQVKSKL